MIPKGTYVEIEKTVLYPHERANHIPLDTKKVPLVMHVKGFLCEESNEHDMVQILTMTKRVETGKIITIHPFYDHTFGHFVEEVMDIRKQILREMEDYHE